MTKYQIGRQLSNNALAIIYDGDSVFCVFPGEWDHCSEIPEHAKTACDALNLLARIQDRHGDAVMIDGAWMHEQDALIATERARHAELVADTRRLEYLMRYGGRVELMADTGQYMLLDRTGYPVSGSEFDLPRNAIDEALNEIDALAALGPQS